MAGFTLQITTTTPNEVVDLRELTVASQTYNATIVWDDGEPNSTVTAYDDADLAHTYVSVGTYEIEIFGQFDGLSVANTGTIKTQITAVIDWGDAVDFDGFNHLVDAFWGCSNLTSLGSGKILAKPGMTSLYRAFFDCIALSDTLRGDFFENCAAVTTCYGAFYGTDIHTVEADAFRPLVACNNFNRLFRTANYVSLSPWMFYRYGEQITRFVGLGTVNFELALAPNIWLGSQGAVPDLWNCKYDSAPVTTSVWGIRSATTDLNWSDVPTDWGGPNTDPIVSYATSKLYRAQTGAQVRGYNFGASGAKLDVSNTDDIGDAVEATVTSQDANQITFTIPTDAGLLDGTIYVWAEDSGANVSDSRAVDYENYRLLHGVTDADTNVVDDYNVLDVATVAQDCVATEFVFRSLVAGDCKWLMYDAVAGGPTDLIQADVSGLASTVGLNVVDITPVELAAASQIAIGGNGSVNGVLSYDSTVASSNQAYKSVAHGSVIAEDPATGYTKQAISYRNTFALRGWFAPTIDSIDPSPIAIGSHTHIHGDDFMATPGTVWVTDGPVFATANKFAMQILAWNNYEIQVRIIGPVAGFEYAFVETALGQVNATAEAIEIQRCNFLRRNGLLVQPWNGLLRRG